MFFLVLVLTAILLFCIHLLWKCSYWLRHGVRGPRGLPILGNMGEFFLGRKHYGDVYKNLYDDHPNLPYLGIYRLFNEPAVLLRSEEMIKEVMIRSFHHFQDNVLWINRQRDPIVCYNPFIAKGELWKNMRGEIVPIFTPNKVKASFPHIKSVCGKLDTFVSQQINNSNNFFEAKDLCSKYTLDVVASAGYGLDGASLDRANSDFTQLVEHLFMPNAWSLLETIALLFSPFLGDIIKYHYVPAGVQQWLRGIIGTVLEGRCLSEEPNKDNVASRPSDFLQWLIEGRHKLHEPVDVATMVGHCSTFLLEGFETSSSLMAFALYEYAKHPLVQARVQKEIDEVLARHGGEISYEAIQEMSYLGATLYGICSAIDILSEIQTLRLYPPMTALLKQCTKEFEFPPQSLGGKSFQVPVGMVFIIPVKAVHYDADLYEHPLQFQPDRFLDQSSNANKSLFLGFGEGPRMCPGIRFGLAQSKAGIVTLLSKYSVSLDVNLKPFKIAATTFLTASQDGIWISFEERK